MRIRKFHGSGVHGYLSFDLKLNDQLTFLNGINGSGKTTVVNCIISLITPDLEWLASTRYVTLSVEVENEGNKIRIQSEKTDADFILRCSATNTSLKIPLQVLEEFFGSTPRRRYVGRSGDVHWHPGFARIFEENPVLAYIESLPTPMFLGLERTTRRRDLREREIEYPSDPKESRRIFRGSVDDGLREAAEIARDAFQRLRRRQEAVTADLRQKLILSAFQHKHLSDERFPPHLPRKADASRIDQDFRDVRETLLRLGIEEHNIDRAVKPFFVEMKDILNRLPPARTFDEILSNKSLQNDAFFQWMVMRPQERRINQIVGFIGQYNKDVADIRAPVYRYEGLVNRFLNDSKKSIQFSEEERVVVQLPNDELAALTSLSSGERQIVVILTHLVFNESAQRANVLIIDEPEISLHVRWQELFVESLTEANPETQIILATHSPSIILDRIEYCVQL